VNGVTFSPDGRTVVSGSSDRTIIAWDVNLDSWQNRACSIVNRQLSAQEIDYYMPGTGYLDVCLALSLP
jgi:WD40 repeat protein